MGTSLSDDCALQVAYVELWISQADFLAAGAMQLLLKLKRHLKIVYGLDDVRCQVMNVIFKILFGFNLMMLVLFFD